MAEAKLKITDEFLVAYVDDELDATRRAMVRSTLERDPALCRRAQQMRLARDVLREAFPLHSDGEVPAGIVNAEKRFAAAWARASGGAHTVSRLRLKHAVAAGLVLCALASAAWLAWEWAIDPSSRLATAVGRIDPGNPLHSLLESTPSARLVQVPEENASMRTILTFRATDGRFCREFEVFAPSGGSTGIACREHGQWKTEFLLGAAAAPASSNYYTPAGTSDDAALAAVVDSLMQGEPFSAEEETRVLGAGWRTDIP